MPLANKELFLLNSTVGDVEMLTQTFDKINKVFQSKKKFFKKQEINDLAIEIRNILLEADIPYDYTTSLVEDMKKKLSSVAGKKMSKKAIIFNFLKMYINNTFNDTIVNSICLKNNDITTIGVYGSCGVGKTLFTVKLANFFQKKYKKKALCVSFDFKKRLSCAKLKTLCKNNYIDYIDMADFSIEKGIRKVNEIIKYRAVDVLIIDNASITYDDCSGDDVVWKIVMDSVKFDEKIVVLDGTCGQSAKFLIDYYNDVVCPTGFAISKVDCSQKGGVFFSVAMNDKPIYYISNGEKINSIKEFDKEIASVLFFEQGEIKNIVDSVKASGGKNEKKCILPFSENHNIRLFKLDYNDFLKQLILFKKNRKCKLASFLLKIAAVPKVEINIDAYIFVEKWISIIMSMTKSERLNIGCLNNRRIKRIANGAGVTIDDVVMLQKKIEEINKKLTG